MSFSHAGLSLTLGHAGPRKAQRVGRVALTHRVESLKHHNRGAAFKNRSAFCQGDGCIQRIGLDDRVTAGHRTPRTVADLSVTGDGFGFGGITGFVKEHYFDRLQGWGVILK